MSAGEAAQPRDAVSERDSKLALDQLGLALRNLGPNYFLMPIFAAIVCVMFRHWVDTARLITWFAFVTLSGIPLGIITTKFRRRMPDATEWQWWVRCTTAFFAVSSAAWVSMGIFLWAPHNDLSHMLIMLFLACTVAGNSALVGASRPVTAAVFLTSGLAMVLTPLQEGGLIYNGISLLAVFFVGYLMHMTHHVHATARDMLLLRNDKNDLIAALASAKTESDQARDRAEAASRAKSQFLANMSHELRTPLNAILGFSELISARMFENNREKYYEFADLIHGSGRHLLALINGILDLAKIEAGRLELHEATFDLETLIAEAIAVMKPKAEAGGCRLKVEAAADLPAIFADERAIKQILLNLLSNAVKFTPRDGTVTAFACMETSGALSFGVADTGVGIEADDQKRVFQDFGQGRHDVSIADKGTGLGLPIVKGLAEAHGAAVALESRAGIGTRVTVTLGAERTRTKAVMRAAS